MAKKTKEQLIFRAYLDSYYAESNYATQIEEAQDNLKDLRKSYRAAKKMLVKSISQYKEINGREPMKPKNF